MSRFVFPYETLLDVRRREERAQQQMLSSLETHRHDLEGELRQRKGFLDSNREFTRTSLTGAVDIDGLRLHAGLAVQAMRRADSIVVQLAQLQSRLVDARALLVDRMRSRRAVEQLHEIGDHRVLALHGHQMGLRGFIVQSQAPPASERDPFHRAVAARGPVGARVHEQELVIEHGREEYPRQVGIVCERGEHPEDAALAQKPLHDGHPERNREAHGEVGRDEEGNQNYFYAVELVGPCMYYPQCFGGPLS